MNVTPASQAALSSATRLRIAKVDARIETAIKKMRRRKAPITVSALAREAGVSRSVIHRRPELVERIHSLAPMTEVMDEPVACAAASESSIVTALRSRLKAKEIQINDLKNQLRERETIIATLHGELANRPPAR
jgi:hypothetical protein